MRLLKLALRLTPFFLLAAVLLTVRQSGLAQTDAGECPALVEEALSNLGQNCDALDRNSACYGYNRVNATFFREVSEEAFRQPSDRSPLVELQTIATTPLNVAENLWGIAVLNVQANLPNTLPGQAVTFLLLGDVAVENAVAPEDALQPAEPLAVRTLVGANIRSAPTTNANVIGSVPAETELQADGQSADGGWLRVLFSGAPGWVSRQIIDTDGDLSSLPAITQQTRSPMQAFYFRASVGDAACAEAPPSLLVIQGPENARVNLTANGADISIGSTIVLMLLPNNQMQLIVIDGQAQLGDLIIPAGFKIIAPLSDDGKSLVGPWTNFSPLTQEDLDRLKALENLPANLLHYPIILPTMGDIQALLDSFNNVSTPGSIITLGPAAGDVDCTPFKPTSPLDGLPYGLATFYWDAAPGATGYRVNLFNESGALVASYETNAPNTSLVGDTSSLGSGFTFSWQVVALFNGQVACSSTPATMFREAPPGATQATPEATAVETPYYGYCGDEICQYGETCFTCPSDCFCATY